MAAHNGTWSKKENDKLCLSFSAQGKFWGPDIFFYDYSMRSYFLKILLKKDKIKQTNNKVCYGMASGVIQVKFIAILEVLSKISLTY